MYPKKNIDGESNSKHEDRPRNRIKRLAVTQVPACLIASVGNLSCMAVFGWSAATLPSMKEDPDIVMDTASVAWIVSILYIGCAIGSFLSGNAMDWLGRRTLIMVTAPFLAVGWGVIALAPNMTIILLGRFICGTASAFVFSAAAVYCSEVPEAYLRGRLGIIPCLFNAFGLFLSYLAGTFFPWRTSCYICLTPIIITLIALWIIPESPYWYLLKGRNQDCEAALRWLRGSNNVSAQISEMTVKLNSAGNKAGIKELWRPGNRKPFLISLLIPTIHIASGGNILAMFTGLIFLSAGVADPSIVILVTGLVSVLVTIICFLAIDYFGRRPLFIFGTLITSLSTILLGLYYLFTSILSIYLPTWITVFAVLAAISGYGLTHPIPLLMSSELLNTKMRSIAHAMYLFYSQILTFIITQAYPFFEESCGPHTVFFTFGALGLVGVFVSIFFFPETKGKTLEQIQEHYESSQKNQVNQPTSFNQIPSDKIIDDCILKSYKVTY